MNVEQIQQSPSPHHHPILSSSTSTSNSPGADHNTTTNNSNNTDPQKRSRSSPRPTTSSSASASLSLFPSSTSTSHGPRRHRSRSRSNGAFREEEEDTTNTTSIPTQQPQPQPQPQSQPMEIDDGAGSDSGCRSTSTTGMSMMSGEQEQLEGSTLGSSSRDGETRKRSSHSQRERQQRRTQSSSGTGGGFLLDTAFLTPSASKFLRGGSLYRRSQPQAQHQAQSSPSEASGSTGSGSGKRRVSAEAQPELVVPKKKSRRPWHRNHKPSLGSSPLGKEVTNASTAAEEIPPHHASFDDTHARAASAATNGSPTIGLDTDSAQIVNLALNLSESRRRSYQGRFVSSPIPGSGGGRRISYGGQSHPSQGHHRVSGYTAPEDGSRAFPHSMQQVGKESPTLSGLGFRTVDDGLRQVPYEPSQATLARAEKARVHFELFFEYLRLLPHLPPLRITEQEPASGTASQTSDGVPSSRVYNPLQAIRNRKVRFREKCPIDTESEGWHDVARVHEWVNSIEENHGDQKYEPDQCVLLPPFHSQRQEDHPAEERHADGVTSSPASSLRRGNTVKLRRPRIDWITSPAELLADAAWLEDGLNKTKIVDKDGNRLYPESTEFKRAGKEISNPMLIKVPTLDQQEISGEEVSSPVLPSFHHSAPRDARGRGRHRHRLQNSLHISGSRSASEKGRKSKFRRSVMGSSSSSSTSTSDDESSRGRGRSHWGRRLNSKLEGAILDKRISDLRDQESPSSPKFGEFSRDDVAKRMASAPTQASQLPSPETRLDSGGQGLDPPRGSISSATSTGDKDYLRTSMDSTAPNSPSYAGYFPSIAVNLSPPSSRSPSPARKALPRMRGPFHERNRSRRRNKLEVGGPTDESSPEPNALQRKETVDIDPLERVESFELTPVPDRLSSDERPSELRRMGSTKGQKPFGLQESKLRGIFKGGRIAEIVGNEVSRVGDLIWKKDSSLGQLRRSSTSSDESDYRDSDREKGATGDSKSGSKALLKRLPTSSDEGQQSRRETEDSSKSFMPNLPTFTSPFKQDEGDPRKSSDLQLTVDSQQSSARDGGRTTNAEVSRTRNTNAGMFMGENRRGYGLEPALDIFREQNRPKIKDPSEPFSLTRPPVTGLANVDPRKRRPTLSEATRSWSISDRSVTALATADQNLADKREIERVRALLLTSGVKAREICRRQETVRSTPADFLVKSLANNASALISRVPQIEEFDLAARNLVHTFETTRSTFQHSMTCFSTMTSPSLKTELENLENLINQSLTPRVRAAAADAETLSTQLNTTSTLAVKQLSDALDKGIRKRNRRFRWVRRVGFVLLEWVVVGVMWWVWLIVMMFKITRGIWRGAVSGIRWVLWL